MTVLFYWLGAKAYELTIRVAALWNEKAAEAVRGRRGLLLEIESAIRGDARPRVWMHCASLGEFEQGRPVFEALREKHPDYALVLTFFSPSGYRVRKNWDGADYVFYLPFDGARRARRLVNALRPALAIWVKYEFWYFTLRALRNANVPTVLIAAVFSNKAPAFRWWGRLHRRMARMFDWIFTQDDDSREKLLKAGVISTSRAGDPRYDRVIEAASSAQEIEKAARFAASGFTIVAGSTWPADEALLAETLSQFPPEVKLLLVPHEANEAHLQAIEARFENDSERWSRWDGEASPRVLIVDSVGMLLSLYRYADVTYVGGGFGRAGVHNVLEPAAHGVPVLFGPNYERYLEAVQLVDTGGAVVVKDSADLVRMVSTLKTNAMDWRGIGLCAGKVVRDGAGATERIVEQAQQFLGKEGL